MSGAPLDCVVVDAGARYGLHPSWAPLRDLARFHLFELDAEEADRLRSKYAACPNIVVHPVALHDRNGTLTVKLRRHKGMHSTLAPNPTAISAHRYMEDEQAVVGEIEVPARTLADAIPGERIDFLKLDTEGSELTILQGAGTLLHDVLGVRVEVSFVPMWEGIPLFGDIDRYLGEHGFELLNLDYTGRGHPGSKFTRPDRYGKLIATDAVWIATQARIFNGTADAVARRAVLSALFLLHNHASDVALDVLLQASARPGVDLQRFAGQPLFRALQRAVLLLFKDLTYLPYLDKSDIRSAYRMIFGSEFPEMNAFYESDLL